jgi:putative flippase GtrA
MPKLKKPSKQNLLQFVYFNFGGVVFFVSGYAVFALLYGVFGWYWWVAKGIADLIGWGLNYIIQRYLAFKDESKAQSQKKLIGKYVGFSLVNVLIDYALVAGLYALGVSPFLGLWISSLFFTVWKYVWYKFWVFKNKDSKK